MSQPNLVNATATKKPPASKKMTEKEQQQQQPDTASSSQPDTKKKLPSESGMKRATSSCGPNLSLAKKKKIIPDEFDFGVSDEEDPLA